MLLRENGKMAKLCTNSASKVWHLSSQNSRLYLFKPLDTEYENLGAYGYLYTDNIGQSMRYLNDMNGASFPANKVSGCQKMGKIESILPLA